jgi:hypothetical protein
MLKDNYYHFLDADYTDDAVFLFLNLCPCNPRLKNYRLIELLKTQSMWNTSGKGMDTGELSGFTSMISAI